MAEKNEMLKKIVKDIQEIIKTGKIPSNKILSIKELKKRHDFLCDQLLEYIIEDDTGDARGVELLHDILCADDDFEEGVRERIELFSAEKTSEKTTTKFLRNVFLDIRLEELRRVLEGCGNSDVAELRGEGLDTRENPSEAEKWEGEK